MCARARVFACVEGHERGAEPSPDEADTGTRTYTRQTNGRTNDECDKREYSPQWERENKTIERSGKERRTNGR